MATLSTYRVYTSNDSFLSLQKVSLPGGEIQVALAFARDYDKDGNSTNGIFYSYFNKEKVTPDVISNFRRNAVTPVKFFLSIGGRSDKFPFSLTSAGYSTWFSNAVNSLTGIIQQYQLDGIDVYYEHINNPQFLEAIGSLIKDLRNKGIITKASIAPSAAVNLNYYYPLYKQYSGYINTVVYQSHDEVNPIPAAEGLQRLFQDLVINYYPKGKLLLGHSVLPKDWFTVSRAIVLGALPSHLEKLVSGISNWTVITDDPESENAI